MTKINQNRIKHIFKSEKDIKDDSIAKARNNLKENKKPKKKKKTPFLSTKPRRNSWARRLFYGPGTLWGGGNSNPSHSCNHSGQAPSGMDFGGGSSDGGSSGGTGDGGGSGGSGT